MANSRKSPKKSTPVTEFPQTAATVAEIPEEFQEPTPPAAPAAPRRNPLKKKNPTLPADGDFFARVAAVPQSDWDSQRVFLYLYVLEPLCNLKQQGGKAYFNRYSTPIRDEHQIAVECGSGRYRLMLAYNRVSAEDSSEMARYEFEIYNPQYPPKVPRAAWINDPRNAKWEALLPKEASPAAAGAAGQMVEAMQLVNEIRSSVRDEMEPPADTQSPSEMVQTFKAMKDILAPANGTPAAPADPFDTAKKIMEMRANDPMTTVLMGMIDSANKATEAAREREFKLQEKLLEAKAAPAKGLLDQLLELAALGDKLDPLKKLFGFGNGTEAVGRAARTTGFDMVRDIVQSPFGANLGQGLGMLLHTLATTGAPAPNPARPVMPTVLNAQQPNGTAANKESDEERIQRIGNTITTPMLYEFFLKDDQSGEAFAERMFDMWPEDYIFIRALGPENLVARYRQFPPAWAILQPKEPAFIQFITDFCKWDPNEDEGPAPGPDDGVIDLEPKEAGA